jgi:hypothetical protein
VEEVDSLREINEALRLELARLKAKAGASAAAEVSSSSEVSLAPSNSEATP